MVALLQHGGNVVAFAHKVGCKIDEVIDLSSNINFVKPTIDVDFNALAISSYPNYDKLYRVLAQKYKLKPNQIELFNGATVGIHALFRELNLNHCTLYAPLYAEYEHSAKSYGYEIDRINRFDGIHEEVKENSLVIFVNPSTPDGVYYDLELLLEKWREKNCTILIDESFLDFTEFPSMTHYLMKYEKLYILKSMTKFYASAGIRIGAIFSNEANIQKLREKEPLWKISEFDSCYLQSALRDIGFKKRSQGLNEENKALLIEILEASPWVEKVFSSSVNFVLIKLKGMDAKAFQTRLEGSNIMVRDCSNFDFLDEFFVRIAVKNREKLLFLKNILDVRYRV